MEYPKIQTIFKRDMTKNGKIMVDHYSMPEFEYLKDNKWIFTEKVDGTNIRIEWNGEIVTIKGKTDRALIPTFLFIRLQELFVEKDRTNIFREVFRPKDDTEKIDVCLYGEGYGARIQKGGGNYKPDGVDFVLIDVRIGYWWLKREDVEDIANKFGIEVVPIVGEGTLQDMVEKVKNGFNSKWGNFLAEGIVARPEIELKDRKGRRIITKLKYKDFK